MKNNNLTKREVIDAVTDALDCWIEECGGMDPGEMDDVRDVRQRFKKLILKWIRDSNLN